MATPKRTTKRATKRSSTSTPPIVVYVHGIGQRATPEALKLEWDIALFGRDMESQSRLVYWADIAGPGVADNAAATRYAQDLLDLFGAGTSPSGTRKKITGLPAFLRKPLTRAFLKAFIGESAAYFFKDETRKRIQDRMRAALRDITEPITLITHSQGSVIALDILASSNPAIEIAQFVTLGSPLGVTEIQDHLALKRPLMVPAAIQRWTNFADPLDPVAFDKALASDFAPHGFITDDLVINTRTLQTAGFNAHSAVGYLAHPRVREVVHDALKLDKMARFLVARDVAASMVSDARQPVLIEVLEPGYSALGEESDETHKREQADTTELSVKARIDRVALELKKIVKNDAAARIDPLKRFVAARLTPSEIREVAARHRDLRVYAVWRSASKRKLLRRSGRALQVDAARRSYGAAGTGVRWAVLDTGANMAHPHFADQTIDAVWDCTEPGAPRRLARDRDRDGHGTHVAGIIAGASRNGQIEAMAPRARLTVYKVLDDAGSGEDAWIIKALDHIAATNDANVGTAIHGINLSLGGPYDATVYGCGFSPICAELRRQWRSGVLVVVACGNEGQIEVDTPGGALDINAPMSIGDPANLEDCIAVGSVHADRPHLYGISSFSSRGPTSDGRGKPDVVAPGERIASCNARFQAADSKSHYREESGTSMAAPHVSGLLAAFLSARREFIGRPDEVKRILLETCTDLGRDRYHQGRGMPNLMKMLLAI